MTTITASQLMPDAALAAQASVTVLLSAAELVPDATPAAPGGLAPRIVGAVQSVPDAAQWACVGGVYPAPATAAPLRTLAVQAETRTLVVTESQGPTRNTGGGPGPPPGGH